MRSILLAAGAAVLLVSAGVLLWMGLDDGQAALPVATIPPEPAADTPTSGDPPPAVPEARTATREERRFNRYDRDRDGRISRVEMMSTRTAAFRKLDRDGNNLLTFEEWAAATGERFATADADRSGWLSRAEFRTTARPQPETAKCSCN